MTVLGRMNNLLKFQFLSPNWHESISKIWRKNFNHLVAELQSSLYESPQGFGQAWIININFDFIAYIYPQI